MKIRRCLIQLCVAGVLLSALSPRSVLAQVLFFDNFQPFVAGTVLTSTNYTPRFGPAAASVVTSVQSGSPTITVSNFLGNNWAYFNNSAPANQNQYKGILSSIQTNQSLLLTWNLWIQGTNTGPGLFQLSVPASGPNATNNPLISFTDTGSIIALTNGTNAQVLIGNWGYLARTVMTNSLLLDYPDGTFSYSLNGQTLATLPLGPLFTNAVGAVYFNGFERSAGSLGNRFALANVGVEAYMPSIGFIYMITNNTITITGYNGTNTAVIIPGTINGLPVTAIGSYAFENEAGVTSVTIPGSVTSIGPYAFLGSGLTSLVIGGSVTNIGSAAFGYCNSLTNVTISGNVASIGGIAFILDTSLTGIYFLGNVPTADNTVFSGDASGTVYYVPGTSGWTNFFGGLPAVARYLPSPVILGSNYGLGVKTNGFGFTVSWATNLSIIVEATTNPANLFWTPVATNTLSKGFFYFNDPQWTNYSRRFYRLAGTNVFASFTASPTNGVVPMAVQFSSSNIDSLGNTIVGWHWNFGDGATSTAQNPSHTYTNIGIFNPGFTATNSHGGVLTGHGPQIATFSFLTTTTNGTITITGFFGNLASALTIPGTLNGLPVTGIGPRAFYFCPGLTNVTIPASISSIGDYAFNSCGSLGSVVLGTGVTNIGNFAFTFDSSLTGLTLPAGVTSIGSNAFAYCAGLTSLTIPDSVTSLGNFAFYSCGSLTNVVLGNGVTNIGDFAFAFCTNLTGIAIPQNVVSLGNSAFCSCSNLADVTIGCENIGDFAFGYCGNLYNVAIGSSVTNIGNFAFAWCNSLTGITIPGQITGIGINAFYSCSNLANLTIGGGNIGDYAFSACGSLGNVMIGDGVQSIGVGAFAGCSSLPGVTLPGSVASIGGYAFGADTDLTRIYFAGSAPIADSTVFPGVPGTVYYVPGATGWTSVFAGLPVVLWNPMMQTGDGNFGVRSNQFGFTITGTANIPIVVETCTNLANPAWTPLLTGTLTNGSLYFSDPAWTNYPERVYRISAE
ncbi:MAG TPA: leucine-rich repeat protein [Candidatus Acidoferrales bacterium]|nr:leucine-rich repeat protein [Candidatus Acidoferrales bacterium]